MIARSRLALLVTAVALAVFSAAPATAHTDLLSSEPAAGEVLTEAPSSVRLTFSEDMSPELATVTVRVGKASWRELQALSGESPTVLVADVGSMPATDSSRTWTLAYRVTSTDGHPVAGELDFSVLGSPSTSSSEGSPGPEQPDSTSEGTSSPPQAEAAGEESADSSRPWGFVVPLGVVLIVLLLASVAFFTRIMREDR